ncbi:MAG TPA: hypothetical protein VM260_16080 [Pirellula sp.]|nr:hypothetical protein [Pirellula sp.]
MNICLAWRRVIEACLASICLIAVGMVATTFATNATQTTETPTAAKIDDVNAAKKRVDALGPTAKLSMLGPKLTEITIQDGSLLTADDLALFGRLYDLKKLQIYNCRVLNSDMVSRLSRLKDLNSLALTNTIIDDAAVDTIVKSFPHLIALDLSSNANMSSQVLKSISELTSLQQLSLLQNKFNDVGTRRLSKLQDLRVLDLRGNMQAGDMTLDVIAGLPKLKALKHRSTAVSDYGMEHLARNVALENLLIQDFVITNQSGEYLAKLKKLTQLEIFRCQGFGSDGVLALKGLNLQRLTLRDLPAVDDSALEVFKELPKLRRLYLHELGGVNDSGLTNLSALTALELLDIWSVPQMTDATIDVIAKLPNLKELTVRSTAVTDAAIDKLLAMPKLQTLTFKENGLVTAVGLKKLSSKKWTKLDIGSSSGSGEE